MKIEGSIPVQQKKEVGNQHQHLLPFQEDICKLLLVLSEQQN
jgi:chemotaxis protein histidine kinase CheA